MERKNIQQAQNYMEHLDIPSTHQQHHNGRYDVVFESNSTSSNAVASATSTLKFPPRPINYKSDIGLDDVDLVTKTVKEFNAHAKTVGLKKERIDEIKGQRRKLKNRGYAKNSRIKKENEKKRLMQEIADLQRKEKSILRELNVTSIEEAKRHLKHHCAYLRQCNIDMRRSIVAKKRYCEEYCLEKYCLKTHLNIPDSDDDLSDVQM